MASAYAAECYRQNAQKSTGPRSPEGKERSRCNAVKHGATGRLLVLPGEQAEELEQRREAWIASRASEDPIELAVVDRALEAWQQIGRTLRIQQARLEERMRAAEQVESKQQQDAALELGNRLFFDRHGPSQCYPNRRPYAGVPPTSGTEMPCDPDQPDRLVLGLESTATGCRWLLARWNELAAILESGEFWHSADRFRAIRLLGKQPLDAVVDRDVLRIYLACHVLGPNSTSPFSDLLRELGESEGAPNPLLGPILKQMTIKPYTPRDSAEARQILASLVDRASARLRTLLADHETREQDMATGPEDRQAFDLDRDGELMRRYEISSDRAFHRALAELRRARKDNHDRGRGTRTAGGEPEHVEYANRTPEPATENGAQSAVGPMLSTVEQPLPETGSREPAPANDRVVPAAGDGGKLRNEAVAAYTDQAGSDGKTGDHVDSATGDGGKLRNEAVAACTDQAGSDGKTGGRVKQGTGDGGKLRNEAVAAHHDRAGSNGPADLNAPPDRPPKPPERPRSANNRPAQLVPA